MIEYCIGTVSMYKLMKGSAVALSLSAFLVGCGEQEQAQESVDSTAEAASSGQNILTVETKALAVSSSYGMPGEYAAIGRESIWGRV